GAGGPSADTRAAGSGGSRTGGHRGRGAEGCRSSGAVGDVRLFRAGGGASRRSRRSITAPDRLPRKRLEGFRNPAARHGVPRALEGAGVLWTTGAGVSESAGARR